MSTDFINLSFLKKSSFDKPFFNLFPKFDLPNVKCEISKLYSFTYL